MNIEIRRIERVEGGTEIIAVIPELERPLTPHYITGDTEEEKQKKRDLWSEELKEFDIKQKEINLLHLGEAELIQKGERIGGEKQKHEI